MTLEMSTQLRHLDVVADLTVSHQLGDFTVTGTGNRIVIDLPGLSRGWKLARLGSEQVGPDGLQACDRVLKRTGLGLEIRMNKRCVARLGEGYIVKRIPGTGSHHAPDCPHYEPPAEFSGLGQVLGSAITEDPATGETTLKLDFPLSKVPGRSTMPPASGDSDSVPSTEAP